MRQLGGVKIQNVLCNEPREPQFTMSKFCLSLSLILCFKSFLKTCKKFPGVFGGHVLNSNFPFPLREGEG
jgi:hypothetical protein